MITWRTSGWLLQVATTTGAASGAFVAGALEGRLLFLLFGLVLLASILPMAFRLRRPDARVSDDWLARSLGLSGTYREANGATVAYGVRRVPGGFALMYLAGLVSGLLGIGSGVLKVLAMDTMMGLPIKVSSATSNFMIGVTAAASAGIYYWRGDVNPIVAGPIALGVLLGATFGARSLVSLPAETIRLLFLIVLGVVSIEMLLRGAGVA